MSTDGGIDVPDETDAIPGTSAGPDQVEPDEDAREEAAQREQGVRSEESRDLSSPQLTVHDNDHEVDSA